MRIIRDAIAWLRVGKIDASGRVKTFYVTSGNSSVAMGTVGYGKGFDSTLISAEDKLAHAEQALLVAHELLGSQKLER